MAALGYASKGLEKYKFDCAGTLISETVILTAAHCVALKSKQPLIVRLGKVSSICHLLLYFEITFEFFLDFTERRLRRGNWTGYKNQKYCHS